MLLIILVIAAGLSAISYSYFVSISAKIDDTVRDDLRRQARIEAFQVTESLKREIQGVANNVDTAASRLAIITGDLENGADFINGRQQSTAEITDRYFWLDKDGKTVWSSAFAGNQEEYDQYKGFDVSDRPYFAHPASTNEPYLSPVIQSPDDSQRMFISYPIVDNGVFKGVIVGSLRADSFGQLVQNKLSNEIESSIGVIDPNGVIMYSRDSSLIGENLFGDKVQSALAPAFNSEEQLAEFNDFLRVSLQGGSDSKDFTATTGPTTTVTYMPVIVRSANEEYHFLTLYLTAPHNIATVVGPLVEQQRNFSLAVIAAIMAVTVLVGYIVVGWNKKLEKTVEERTTSLARAHQQLKIHDKMQTEFINIAAHELRTPVQPLLNIAEQLEEDLVKGVEEIKVSRAEIEMLARNAKRLAQLTGDVLEVARIDSNSLVLRKERLDLKEKIRKVIEDCKVFVEDDQKVDIIFEEPPENQISVHADKSRLFEVLSNLIRNAIKFTNEGTITISMHQKDSVAEVSVKDTGTGIAPSIFSKLFEKFTTKSDKGTGLGLYITKSIIEAHGGKIWAENNQDGKGATFTFTLPMTTTERVEATTK
jgi:signal transduction histidine kinase